MSRLNAGLERLAPLFGEGLWIDISDGLLPSPVEGVEGGISIEGRVFLPGAQGNGDVRFDIGAEWQDGASAYLEGRLTPEIGRLEGAVTVDDLETRALVEGDVALISRWPKLSVDGDFQLSPGVITWDGDVAVRGVGLHESRLSAVEIGPVDLRGEMTARLVNGQRLRLQVQRWEGLLAGIPHQLRGDIELGTPLHVDFEGGLDGVPFQDLLAGIPDEVVPEIADYQLGGALDLSVHIKGPLIPWDETDVQLSGDADTLSLLAGRLDGIPGGYPLEGRVYLPVDPQMAHLGFRLSRSHAGWIPLDLIPPACVQAVVMAEDVTFFQHRGFDLDALSEALSENIEEGRAVRGGSTITQQLAKNLYLSGERTVARKLQEAVLTWELELRLTKPQILETYLNIIEWGPGIYGIGPAARHYFDARPQELSVRRCAYLATIIPGPRKYYRYYRRGQLSPTWKGQVDTLLGKLHRYGKITRGEYSEALEEVIRFAPAGEPSGR